MSGQPTPPRIVEAFAIDAASQYITNPFPVASQIGITDGAASLHDGFPPLTFLELEAGGVPPAGADFNGILYLLSAWVAYLAAGQRPLYDATLQTDMGGYAQGAVLAQAAAPWATWTSLVAANLTDPDTGGAGWISSIPLYASSAPAAGTYTNTAPPTVSDMLLDYDCSAGNINLGGFVAQRNGQRLTVRKSDSSANVLTVTTGTGAAGNQLQAVGDVALAQQYAEVTFQYNKAISAGVGAWVIV